MYFGLIFGNELLVGVNIGLQGKEESRMTPSFAYAIFSL
jgi:hypothetical protein